MIYLLAKRQQDKVKPGVVVGDALKVYLTSGKVKELRFDQALSG